MIAALGSHQSIVLAKIFIKFGIIDIFVQVGKF